ncbi:hypothetical protein, partial [uncultured Gammaproteobacteria bacterium]
EYSATVWLDNHSPPHRWLRNDASTPRDFAFYSPPHRWLRKL